jgi:hypothetical protein
MRPEEIGEAVEFFRTALSSLFNRWHCRLWKGDGNTHGCVRGIKHKCKSVDLHKEDLYDFRFILYYNLIAGDRTNTFAI